MRPVEYDHEIPVLKAIHRDYSKRFNGPFARHDDYYWRYWVRMEGRNLWVIENDRGAIIGYVSFRYWEDGIDIHEFCALPSFEGLFDTVASKLVRSFLP